MKPVKATYSVLNLGDTSPEDQRQRYHEICRELPFDRTAARDSSSVSATSFFIITQ